MPQFYIDVLEQKARIIDNGFGNVIYGSYSRDFRSQRERYYTFGRLFQERDFTERFTSLSIPDKIKVSIEVLSEHIGESQASRFIEDMCLADYILGNVDWHYDNFGVLIRRDITGNVLERHPAPLYDFGMGLFQTEVRHDRVMELESTLMEHDLPIVDFKFAGGKLVYKKEHPENARLYLDLWTPGNITEKRLQDFFTYRVPAWHRPSVQRVCKAGGIIPGDIDGFIRRIHGVWGDDHFWIRFPGETALRWDDVKIRD